ncbi:SDR family NAD(P)-dependent oxidoreductase [Nocardia veterana]|uniref:SDR family NAD(P)-dependent oxidoreductase n=1 Tax=Nocardia veterana TaxID=132249 RepID=A0A7X6LV69_9NOCA|nr:SDR family NAD(P)-dependent oxidoreductase [Nocardia veterana]NKY85128.1 SDR family NAD(P)-dependent oxidoreductase [Nocardia veterana]
MHTLVMTGVTRGIGRFAAERILRTAPDTRLLVIARGTAGTRLCAELSGQGYAVSLIEADLAALSSVGAAARRIHDLLDRGEVPPLTGFVGNAGIQYTNDTTATEDGLEATFTVNVLANHLLLRLLEDRFAVPARIVITVSDTHFGDVRHNLGMVPGPKWRSPDVLARPRAFPHPDSARAGRTAYSTSKLAAIHLVHEYARRLPAGIDIFSYNPGFVPGTDLARDAGPLSRFAVRRIAPLLTATPLAGTARTAGEQLAAVVIGELAAPTGSYIDRDRVADSAPESYDPVREARLWECADQLVAPHRR